MRPYSYSSNTAGLGGREMEHLLVASVPYSNQAVWTRAKLEAAYSELRATLRMLGGRCDHGREDHACYDCHANNGAVRK